MLSFWHDLRLAARQLGRSPGFSAGVVATLALGIALVTVMFSAVDRVLLRPLPFADAERLVALRQFDRAEPDAGDGVAPPVYMAWRERGRTLDGVAAIEPYGFDLTDQGTPETVPAWRVTEDFFPILGVSAALGRTLRSDDYTAGRQVVVLSHALWRRRFGADSGIVGRVLTLDGAPYEVAGVMPPGFDFPHGGEFWAPRVMSEGQRGEWDEDYFQVVARLAPGSRPEQARAELAGITVALASEWPAAAGLGVDMRPLLDEIVGAARPPLLVLLAAVGAVLLIACVNVANLLLARGVRRQRELAVRLALGASPARLARQLFAEALVLAVAGGVLGAMLAAWAADAVTALAPAELLPRAGRLTLDGRALAFTLVVAVVVAVACGLLPALRGGHVDAFGDLQSGARSTGGESVRRVGTGLVGAQVALAVALLAVAALLGRSLAELLRQDPGFEPGGRAALQVFVWDRYDTPEKRADFVERAVERLAVVPGVRAVGAVSALPYAKAWIAMEDPFRLAGRPEAPEGREPTAYTTLATPGYFRAAGIRLVRGRLFTGADGAGAPPVALVNETMARRWWPAGDAVGARVVIGVGGAPVEREIVGVVGDVRQAGLDREPRPELFAPHAQSGFGSMTFVAEVGGDPAAALPALRSAIWSLRPDLPIYDSATLPQLLAGQTADRRFVTVLLGAFALLALALAAIGIYGVIAFVTGQRAREFGIRLALGATPGGIVARTVGESLRVVAAGAAVGLAGAVALAGLLRRFLFGVEVIDPLTWALLVPAVLAVAAAAAWLPARRAGRVDPMTVLRAE